MSGRRLEFHRGVHHQAHALAQQYLRDEGPAWGDLSDPACADGRCTDVAEDFTAWANKQGHRSEVVDLSNEGNHSVSTVGDHAVDFTFRQFDPESDFPLVQPLQRYHDEGWEETNRYKP